MKQPLKFEGRICPPEFHKELTDLRKRGLLGSDKLREAFEKAAVEVRADEEEPKPR